MGIRVVNCLSRRLILDPIFRFGPLKKIHSIDGSFGPSPKLLLDIFQVQNKLNIGVHMINLKISNKLTNNVNFLSIAICEKNFRGRVNYYRNKSPEIERDIKIISYFCICCYFYFFQ